MYGGEEGPLSPIKGFSLGGTEGFVFKVLSM